MQEFATFGQWLKHQRKSQGYTQSALAEDINCAVVTLRKIESDDLRPSQDLVLRILAELKVPAAAQSELVALARNEYRFQRTNLPTPLTRLIGRAYELNRAVQSLRNGTRLVSIVGSPGVGKSRLSLQIASECQTLYPNGCYYLDGANLSHADDFIPALADLLHIGLSNKNELFHTLVQALSGTSILLVLDHCEQLVGIAPIVARLLQQLPRLSMLISSRKRLHIVGEQVLQLPPLALPSQQQLQNKHSFEELRQAPAIVLFYERAQSHSAKFELNKCNIHMVINICIELGGNPLAIELAAAWVTLFSLPQLLQRLKGSFSLLSLPSSDGHSDGRSMRESIQASYQRLEAQEQALLQVLAIFPHGCTLDAATTMMDDENDKHAACHTTNLLAHLLDHNLIYQHSSSEGELRFAVYETIRTFALEQIEQRRSLLCLQGKQNRYFVAFSEQLLRDLQGPQQKEILQRFKQESANLRAILTRESGPNGDIQVVLQLSSALWRIWDMQQQAQEGYSWLCIALEASQHECSALRADLLCGAAHFAYQLGDEQQAKQQLERCLQICRSLNLVHLEAEALALMATIASQRSEHELAYNLFQNALQRVKSHPLPWLEAQILIGFQQLVCLMEEHEDLASIHRRSIKLCRELGGEFLLAQTLLAQAKYFLQGYDYAQAERVLYEALHLFQNIEDYYGEGLSYRYLLELAIQQDQRSKAQKLLYQAQTIFYTRPDRRQEAWLAFQAGQLAQLLGQTHEACELYQSALMQAQQLNERVLRAHAQYQLAHVALVEGNLRQAYEGFYSAAFLMQAIKRPALAERCRCLYERVKYIHNHPESIKRLESLLANYRLLNNRYGIAQSQSFLAPIWLQQDELVSAQEALTESINIAGRLNDHASLLTLLSNLALVCLYSNQSCQTTRLYGLCRALEGRIGLGAQQLYLTGFELEWHRRCLQTIQAYLQNDTTLTWLEPQAISLSDLQLETLHTIAALGMVREVSQ